MKCKNEFKNRFVETAEQIGMFGRFGFMAFNIQGTVAIWSSDEALSIYLLVISYLAILYRAV